MAQVQFDISKVHISDETKQQIKALADKYNATCKEIGKRGFDEKSFEALFYCYGVINLALMVSISTFWSKCLGTWVSENSLTFCVKL